MNKKLRALIMTGVLVVAMSGNVFAFQGEQGGQEGQDKPGQEELVQDKVFHLDVRFNGSQVTLVQADGTSVTVGARISKVHSLIVNGVEYTNFTTRDDDGGEWHIDVAEMNLDDISSVIIKANVTTENDNVYENVEVTLGDDEIQAAFDRCPGNGNSKGLDFVLTTVQAELEDGDEIENDDIKDDDPTVPPTDPDEPVTPPVDPDEPDEPEDPEEPDTGDVSTIGFFITGVLASLGLYKINKEDE